MCLKRDWSRSSNNNNHFTLNNEHNWEDLCIQLIIQQTCTSDSHNHSRRGPIFNPVEHIGIKEAQLVKDMDKFVDLGVFSKAPFPL